MLRIRTAASDWQPTRYGDCEDALAPIGQSFYNEHARLRSELQPQLTRYEERDLSTIARPITNIVHYYQMLE